MSVVIVEGPDGAGKTTLIAKITTARPEAVVHHHKAYLSERRVAHRYFESVYAALNGAFVVMDRSWRSEPIYGAVMRGGTNRLASWEVEALERTSLEARRLVVLCLPPYEACERAWRGRLASEYPKKAGQLRAVYDAYAAESERWPGRTVRYDYTTDDAGDVLKELLT